MLRPIGVSSFRLWLQEEEQLKLPLKKTDACVWLEIPLAVFANPSLTDIALPVAGDRSDARTISSLFSPFAVAAPTPNSIDCVAGIDVASSFRAILIRPMCVHRCATNPTCLRGRNVYWHFLSIDGLQLLFHGHLVQSILMCLRPVWVVSYWDFYIWKRRCNSRLKFLLINWSRCQCVGCLPNME